MTNKISMDKKYKTRDGRSVRVLCVDQKIVKQLIRRNEDRLAELEDKVFKRKKNPNIKKGFK